MPRRRATKERSAGDTSAAGRKPMNGRFDAFAHMIARLAGRPLAFMIALALVLAWAVSGPLFGFSDTWQLVINTSTTIITFLMVFLIQNTQTRDTMALQIKLSELIMVMQGASDELATAEDLSEEDLERLHQHYVQRADHTLASLHSRRRSAKSARQK
jgi:low affinity Fe/Cu permease